MTQYDKFSDTFAKSREHMHWEEIDILLDFLIDWVDTKKTRRVADIWCGNGRLLDHICEHPRLQKIPLDYVGLDLSAGMIAHAESKNFKNILSISFIVADMTEMADVLTWMFDVIFFIASFHHLPDIESRKNVLSQARELLSDGGVICMTNWNLLSDENWLRYEDSCTKKYEDSSADFHIKIWAHKRFYHGFTLDSLRVLFDEAGLKIRHHDLSENGRNIISVLPKSPG